VSSKFKSILAAAKDKDNSSEPDTVIDEVEPVIGKTELVVKEVEIFKEVEQVKSQAESQVKPEIKSEIVEVAEVTNKNQETNSKLPIDNPTQAEPSVVIENSQPKKMGRPKGKRSDPDFEQVTAYIKSATYTSVKIELLKEGQKREFSELMQQLLDNWLELRK
jgi:hypothetical protein